MGRGACSTSLWAARVAEAQTLALLAPAFNAAAFLPRLLASAAEQTAPFDEIWVYDDCSTDDTAAVAARLGARVVRGDVNRGCSFGKNALAQATTCAWVHFHDADDLLLPHFVETARAWMAKDEQDAVLFGCEERDAATGALISTSTPIDADLRADPLRAVTDAKFNSICGLYRRRRFVDVGGYDLDPLVHYNEDQAMHARLAAAGLRLAGDPTIVVRNLRRSGSMSTAHAVECLKARRHVLRKTLAACQTDAQRQAVARQAWSLAGVAAAHQAWPTAAHAARLARKADEGPPPQDSRAFQLLCRVSPALALRAREAAIRLLRPRQRVGYPAWTWRSAPAREREDATP